VRDTNDTNMIAALAILLVIMSVAGPYFVFKQGQSLMEPPRITGRASTTGSISLTILLPPPEMNTLGLKAELAPDNKTIMLSWNEVSRNNFSIYITDNISQGFMWGSPNITGLNVTSWNDTNASDTKERYYKIAVWNTGIEYISNDTVGKFTIEIVPATSVVGQVERNLISLPLIPSNDSVGNVFRWATDLDIISYYNTSASPPQYNSIQYGAGQWWGPWNRVDIKRAYAFQIISSGYNMTIAGTVPEGEITVPIYTATSVVGQVQMNGVGWNSVRTICNISRVLNNESGITDLDIISHYNTSATPPQYNSVQYGAGKWWGPWDCFVPGRGYAFQIIAKGFNWTYNRSMT